MQTEAALIIVPAGIGILLFLCLYIGFRTGLRLGMQTARGQIPAKISPVGSVLKKIEGGKTAERESEIRKGHVNMMNFDGWLPEEKQRPEGKKHG